MESLPIPVGYGVELSTLLDTTARHGLDALAQVDLGSRAHRHQANHDLGVMAAELLALAESRRSGPHRLIGDVTLEQFVRHGEQVLQRSRPVPTHERPPASTVTGAERLDDVPRAPAR
jgi:glucosyl-3-phosphoglycerate synthase